MRTKIAFFDIETFPLRGYSWGPKYESNFLRIDEPIRLASFAWKFLGENTVHVKALCDYPRYKKDKFSDKDLVADLWKLFDESDIIVAHNGNSFDVKHGQGFFIQHGMKPPSPVVSIDTKLVAKRYFKFASNSLNDLGQLLHLGEKERTGGMDLWWDCMDGDMNAWARMKKYNKQDVVLLEQVYTKMLPWIKNHPNLNVYEERVMSCPNCLGSKLQRRGYQHNRTTKRVRYQCQDCGAWCSGEIDSGKIIAR